MRTLQGMLTPNQKLNSLIRNRGGFVNCHAHLDRVRTLSVDVYEQMGDASLPEKWELNEELKASPWYQESMQRRMHLEIVAMREQGCTACRTYLDADTTVGLFAIECGLDAKEYWAKRGFTLQIAASPVKGIDDAENRRIFQEAVALADVVGGLPSRMRKDVRDYDASWQGMYDLFEIAHAARKPLDMQIDQSNHRDEREVAMLVDVASIFRKKGYTQPITAVHCISLSAWKDNRSKRYLQFLKHSLLRRKWRGGISRARCIAALKELDIFVVVCPGAAISMRQDSSVTAPTHNSIAPVVELLEAGVNVAFGVDNVEDMYMPFTTGDIYAEMKEMLDAIRWQGPLEPIADIMSTNGRKVLGL